MDTKSQDEWLSRLRGLRAEGKSLQQIANETGVSLGSIKYTVFTHKIEADGFHYKNVDRRWTQKEYEAFEADFAEAIGGGLYEDIESSD